jgi:DNA-binding transcriptional ArsR family regulator
MPSDVDSRMPVAEAARLFGLLTDETRLMLLLALEYGGAEGIPLGRLAEAIGVTEAAVSYHLAALQTAGAVTRRREGRNVFYSLPPGTARDLLLRHVRP